jgi:putative colanic acid biosynthesis acetyltransferase WcaF
MIEILWWYVGLPLLRSRLLPVSGLKRLTLRAFGARIGTGVYIKPGVSVKFPWYLSIGSHSWIGENVWIDNFSLVTIEAHCCVSQGAYLCTGNHDWSSSNMKFFSREIALKRGSWVGARSTICPGVCLGEGAVAAAGSIVNRSIPPFEVWSGNPAAFVRTRRPAPAKGTNQSLRAEAAIA